MNGILDVEMINVMPLIEKVVDEIDNKESAARTATIKYCVTMMEEISPNQDMLSIMAGSFYDGYLVAEKCRV